ncbi:MAG: FAD-binding oxidoreductase [Rhizobiaceae bacterium]|nr:FAD-binding oxidoreductase [Rhizobiaceae bacterium]
MKAPADRANGPDEHVASAYAASVGVLPERPQLQGELTVDICVIGGGYSGLSTAISLLEKGHQVIVLEGARIGWGASGRNGGQVVNGFNAGLDTITRRYGEDTAAFFGQHLQEGGKIIRQRIEKYGIDCDLKEKNLYTAFTQKHLLELEAKQALWRRHGMDDHEMFDRASIRQHVGSDAYLGGMIDHSGAHLHPLKLALGEAAAVESLGGRIFEQSRVISVDYSGPQPVAKTALGQVRCKNLMICGNAYLGKAVPALLPRILPVSTQVLATEPLSDEQARDILPTDVCVEDCRYILDYFRLSADNRLIFGGGVLYGGRDARDIVARIRPNMLKIFPQLKNTRIDYTWNGNFALSFSRVPQLGQLSNHTWFAHGYSGHGVTGSHFYGKVLADAIHGDLSQYNVLADLPWLPFPGGRLFGAQYSAIGSFYYNLRDKLGF